MTQDFPLGDVLSLTTGRLLSRDGMEGVQRICEFMAGEPVWTHQLPRIMEEAGPRILVQHPDLAAIDVPDHLGTKDAVYAWLDAAETQYGTTRPITQLPDEDHTSLDPVSKLGLQVDEAVSDDTILRVDVARHLYEVYGTSEEAEDRAFAVLHESHEAMRAELDLYRSLALRYADMWQPQFPLDPNEGLWVFPWADDVPDEPMTPEQVEFYRKRREARR